MASFSIYSQYCGRKRIYDKKGAVTAKNKRFEEDHVELRVYECPGNKHWHLTSDDPHRDERRKKKKK